MKRYKKVMIITIAVVLTTVLGVWLLVGMGKEVKFEVDFGENVKEYTISRNYISYLNNKVMYGGSLRREFEERLGDSDDFEKTILGINQEFSPLIYDLRANSSVKVESKVDFVNGKDEVFRYDIGTDGRNITRRTYESILSAIDEGRVATDVYDVDRVKTIEELKEETTLISKYTTAYENSSNARVENIHIASGYLNGVAIAPQSQLSFNEIVGERSKERGFKEANIIIDGEYVKGYGGGVCQVSTTLYNAWVLAGLGVTYATSHSLPPHYVPLSRDAMVSSHNDMILLNTDNTPIYVRSYCGNKDVTFEIYGKRRDVYYEIESKTLRTLPIEDKIVGEVNESEEYDREIVTYGAEGYESTADIITYDMTGNEMSRRLLRTDKYKSQPRIIRYTKKQVWSPIDKTIAYWRGRTIANEFPNSKYTSDKNHCH